MAYRRNIVEVFGDAVGMMAASLWKATLLNGDEAEKRYADYAKRDLDYRDSPYAAKVTVEERGGLVIETRGQRCLGWHSISHVSHNG